MSSQQQPALPPVADIDAVLSRFSAWSASQGAAAGKGGGSRANEVSYEQALQAVARSRRKAGAAPLENAKQRKQPAPASGGRQAKSNNGAAAGKRTAKNCSSSKKRRSDKQAEPRAGQRSKAAAHVAVKSGPAPRPVSAALIPPPSAPASFAEAVRQQHGALVREQSGKSVALTVRLTPEECATIKARAAESGTSVSAYLRQCALEVEHLREQVERALAELRAAPATVETPKPLPLAAPQPRPSLWRRVGGLGARLLGAERVDARA